MCYFFTPVTLKRILNYAGAFQNLEGNMDLKIFIKYSMQSLFHVIFQIFSLLTIVKLIEAFIEYMFNIFRKY